MKKTARNGTTNYPKGQGNLPMVWSPTAFGDAEV